MNDNDNNQLPSLLYRFNQFAILQARNGMRAQMLHYFSEPQEQFLLRYEDGQYQRLNKNLQCQKSSGFDIIGTYPFEAVNAVSTEEIVDLISNYAQVRDSQKREQIRAVITRHAADYQKKPWFPDPKTEIPKHSDN